MNRRSLFLSSIVLITALVLGVVPKLIGMNLREVAIANLFALIPPEYARQMQINETRFDSGWFGSEAQFDIEYNTLGWSDPLVLTLNFDFSHGPVLFTDEGLRFGLAYARISPDFDSRVITEALSDVSFDLPELEMTLLSQFDQTLTVQLLIGPTSHTEEGVLVNFGGLTGTLVANADQSAEITVDMGTLSAEEGANGFILQGLTVDSQTEQLSDLLAPSSADLRIPALSATGLAAFTATDISAQSRLTANQASNELIDITQVIALGKLLSDYPLESFTWTSEIRELRKEVVRSYYEILNSAEAATSGSADPDLAELAQQMLLVLAQNSLVFNNNIDANVYQGDHSLELLVNWLGLPQLGSVNAVSVEQIISALEVELHVSLDLEAIARSPFASMIDPYVQEGYITLDNGRVLLDISLINEQFFINGEVTELGNFTIRQSL
jgi:uncharacterized protein YdgA (DUF945 family)